MLIQPVTMCGKRQLQKPEIMACLKSWPRLVGVAPFLIFDDGSLDQEAVEQLSGIGRVVPRAEADEKAGEALKSLPSIAKLRCSVSFRKILDPVAVCDDSSHLLWLDSDIYFAQRCTIRIPEQAFVFGVDDASCYGGSWRITLHHPMLLGLNAGFLLFTREVVDFEFLEHLAAKYFLPVTPPYRPTMEQAAWAALGARVSAAMFSGHDYRIVNGFNKRTRHEHQTNRVKLWSPNTRMDDFDLVRSLIKDVAVIHFAGAGRQMIQRLASDLADAAAKPDICEIRTQLARPAGPLQRLLLASRMWVSHRLWYPRAIKAEGLAVREPAASTAA